MIKVNIRDKSQLITLECTGKSPIRGRISSAFFHSPLELLLCSLGLCSGGIIVNYCRLNNINVAIFEEIQVGYREGKFVLSIKCPKEFPEQHKKQLSLDLESCNIAKELKNTVEICWGHNTLPTEELLKEPSRKCCGG